MDETKINELTDQISKMRTVLDDLTAQLEAEKNKVEEKKEPSIEDRWKPNKEDKYYTVTEIGTYYCGWYDDDDTEDEISYNNYNTWKTEARAEEVFNKTKLLWLMEQIYDILCPDYKPNWEDNNMPKYYVSYDITKSCWFTDYAYSRTVNITYFDINKHAEQACKILNDMGVKPI